MVERVSRLVRWSSISVRTRLMAIVGLLVTSLTIVGVLAALAFDLQTQAAKELSLVSLAQHHQQDADMQHDALRAYVYEIALAGEYDAVDVDAALRGLAEDAERFRANLEALERLDLGPELEASLVRTRPAAAAYITTANALASEFLRDRANALAMLPEFDMAFDETGLALGAETAVIRARIDRANAQAERIGNAAQTQITYAVIGLSVFAGLVVFGLAKSIRRTLRGVRDVATAMAAGNLAVRNQLGTDDELGELASALDRMAGSLNDMIAQLRADAERDAFGSQLIEALEMVDTEREVHQAVARAMTAIAPDRPMELLLADSSRAQLERAAEHPLTGAPGCSVESPFSCIAVRRSNPVSFADSDALNACPRLRGRPGGSISAVCVPVSFMGRSLGVLHTTGPVDKLPASEQIAQLTTLGMQAGARIGTVRAFERTQVQAATDSLTGLANRRALEDSVRKLGAQNRGYALVMGDIDHFKKLNDTFGHSAGDNALRVFADTLRDCVRAEDHPARWGGEEFAVIMPSATAETALKMLERLRDRLVPAIKTAGARPFTASFGVADTSMSKNFDDLVHIADEALYRSKEAGRNRATIGTPNGTEPQRHDTEHAAKIDIAAVAQSA